MVEETAGLSRARSCARLLFWSLLLLVSFLLARLDLRHSTTSLLDPGAGVVFLWLVSGGRRTWVVDGAVIVALTAIFSTWAGTSAASTTLWFILLAPAVVTVAALRGYQPEIWSGGGQRLLGNLRQFGSFLLVVVLATLAGAVVRTALGVVLLDGSWDMVWLRWARTAGALIVLGTVGLLAADGWRERPGARTPSLRSLPRGKLVEAAALTAVVTALIWFGFYENPQLPSSFFLTFAIVWTGLRFPPLLVATQALLVGIATTWMTQLGYGPLASIESPEMRAIVAQFFVAVMTVTGMVIALTRVQLTRSISRTRTSEAALGHHAAELDLLLSNLRDGVAIVDAHGEFTHTNTALRVMFAGLPGASPERLESGVASRYLFHSDGRPFTYEELPQVRAIHHEVVTAEEIQLRLPAQAPKVLEVSAVRLPDAGHNVPRAMVTVHDATAEKAHRDALTQFAATVAHDLNNPLSVASGWAEQLDAEFHNQDTVPAPLGIPMVGLIQQSVERAQVFTRELLHHAQASDQALECEPVALSELAAEVVAMRVPERVAALQNVVGPPALPAPRGEAGSRAGPPPPTAPPRVSIDEMPFAWVDRALVLQLFDNLIGNGLKYAAPGRPARLHVRAIAVNGWVEVHVLDNGIGVAAADRVCIFDDFHRVDRAASPGTGLGLAICKRIVERHGGHIHVEPNLDGVGCCFVFTLPATSEAYADRVSAPA